MQTVYLIRHGEISQSKPRRFVGRRDLPLTKHGREQIARLAEFLAKRAIDKILTSPLSRCVESAHIINKRLQIGTPHEMADLQEISLGDWEGLTVEEVKKRYPGEHEARGLDITNFRPSGGESFADILLRAWPAFETISATAEKPVAVIAHSGTNRALLCQILGIPLGNLFRLDQDYGCVNIIHLDSAVFRLERINYRPQPGLVSDSVPSP